MMRYEALDAWRGISAILVVLFHFCFIFASPLMDQRLITNAYLLVDFFFVLSGFVVCHAYRARLGDAASWRVFVLRRFGRLWPLHIAMLTAFVVFIALVNLVPHPQRFDLTLKPSEYSLVAIPIHALLLNAVNLHGMAWNAPSWSIGAEFYTYLLFGAVCILMMRGLTKMALALAVASLALLAWRSPTFMNSTADLGLFRCIAGFFIGVAAYGLHARLRHLRLPVASLWEMAAVAGVVTFVVLAGEGPDKVGPQSLAAPLVFAVAVLVFARDAGLVSRVLRTRPLAALGRWSYSIYMTHQLVLMAGAFLVWTIGRLGGFSLERAVVLEGQAKTVYDLGSTAASFAALAGVLAVVLALSALTHRFIELPGQRGFNRLAARMEQGVFVRRVYALARTRTR